METSRRSRKKKKPKHNAPAETIRCFQTLSGYSLCPSGGKHKGTVCRSVCASPGVTGECHAGFRCPAYAGESGEKAFISEAPCERVEDISYAVDYLVSLPFVDEERIGALGLCDGGGYMSRICALAGVTARPISARKPGRRLRNRSVAEQIAILEDVSRLRIREARREKLMEVYMCPAPTAKTAPSFREGYDYYRTPRRIISGQITVPCSAVRQ